MEQMKKQESMGAYTNAFMKHKDAKGFAERKLVLYFAVHNLPFEHFDHLIKTLKEALPDSEIVKSLKMGKSSASYHLSYGLSMTERTRLDDEVRNGLFSASLDGGSKGNKKRTEIFIKYWSPSHGKVIESFFHAETLNVENATNVTSMFVSLFKDRNIDLNNLINLHTDSCAVLRGKKSGALKQISKEAPKIVKSDIGGDILHHCHNSVKKAFKEVFPGLITLLKCIKYDIRSSPAKIERYLETCDVVGEVRKMPASFCESRFLDRYLAVTDLLEHIGTFKEFYSRSAATAERLGSSDDTDTDSDGKDLSQSISLNIGNLSKDREKEGGNWKGNPSRRLDILRKSFLDPNVAFIKEVQLNIARESMKLSFDFLRIFQSGEVKIHLLFDSMKELVRTNLHEIVEPAALKNSKGEKLDGKELKDLILETKEERQKRQQSNNKSKLSLSKSSKFQRHAQMFPTEGVLLSKELRDVIDSLLKKYGIPSDQKETVLLEVKSIKLKYHVELSKAFQHYLPLENEFLKRLKFFCPKMFVEKAEAEYNLVKVARQIEVLDVNEEDSLRREIRHIKENKEDTFSGNLAVYMERHVHGFKLQEKEPNLAVDLVWKEILSNEIDFPLMSKLLRAVFSIFHSTATVEGAINTTRNILKERSHSLLDVNLNARKQVKSSVKNSNAKCCFDFKVDSDDHRKNWSNSYGEYVKQGVNNVNNNSDDDSDNQEDGKCTTEVVKLDKKSLENLDEKKNGKEKDNIDGQKGVSELRREVVRLDKKSLEIVD